MTPLIKEYFEVRNQLPEKSILFYRMGDFWEVFGDDTEILREKEFVVTKRNETLMAGVPNHIFCKTCEQIRKDYSIFILEKKESGGYLLSSHEDKFGKKA